MHNKKKSISRFFLLRQIWIVNYYVKNPVKNENENKKSGVSRKIVCFVDFNSHFVLKTTEMNQCLCFHYFWRNNWRSIFDVVKRLCYCIGILCINLKLLCRNYGENSCSWTHYFFIVLTAPISQRIIFNSCMFLNPNIFFPIQILVVLIY